LISEQGEVATAAELLTEGINARNPNLLQQSVEIMLDLDSSSTGRFVALTETLAAANVTFKWKLGESAFLRFEKQDKQGATICIVVTTGPNPIQVSQVSYDKNAQGQDVECHLAMVDAGAEEHLNFVLSDVSLATHSW
jgi:hypothetical protein